MSEQASDLKDSIRSLCENVIDREDLLFRDFSKTDNEEGQLLVGMKLFEMADNFMKALDEVVATLSKPVRIRIKKEFRRASKKIQSRKEIETDLCSIFRNPELNELSGENATRLIQHMIDHRRRLAKMMSVLRQEAAWHLDEDDDFFVNIFTELNLRDRESVLEE
jgi:hypothetical protein